MTACSCVWVFVQPSLEADCVSKEEAEPAWRGKAEGIGAEGWLGRWELSNKLKALSTLNKVTEAII